MSPLLVSPFLLTAVRQLQRSASCQLCEVSFVCLSHGHLPHQRPGGVIPGAPALVLPTMLSPGFPRQLLESLPLPRPLSVNLGQWRRQQQHPQMACGEGSAITLTIPVGISAQLREVSQATDWHRVCHHVVPHMCFKFISHHPLNNQPHSQITTTTNSQAPRLGRI